MPLPRFLLLPSALLILALPFAGCGKKAEEAKAPPKPSASAPAPVVVPAKPEGPPPPEKGAKPHPTFEGLAAARIDGGYVRVLYQNGRKGLFPTADLTATETEWLKDFITEHPLAAGKSSVVIAKVEVKKTIEKQETKDGVETVQLVAPAKLRDQIGGTCMFYARVHYLDIAGYPVEDSEIYRVINNVPKDTPYLDHNYHVGMQMLFLRQKPSPLVHYPSGTLPPFEWARQELRKGHPILSALPQNMWLSLPADFLATHPWDGNSKIGHQIVINGFTYNPATKKGTFHIVNSWRSLAEFDVPVESRDEQNFIMEQSLSPKGEPPEQVVKIVASAATLIKTVGKQNLYSVETNVGSQRVLAASEEAAKSFVEADLTAKDMETQFGESVIKIFDYIQETADPRVRDIASAQLLAETFRIPATVALPHVDLEVKSATGRVYFVRTAPDKVLKLTAESTGEALEKARKMSGGPKT